MAGRSFGPPELMRIIEIFPILLLKNSTFIHQLHNQGGISPKHMVVTNKLENAPPGLVLDQKESWKNDEALTPSCWETSMSWTPTTKIGPPNNPLHCIGRQSQSYKKKTFYIRLPIQFCMLPILLFNNVVQSKFQTKTRQRSLQPYILRITI